MAKSRIGPFALEAPLSPRKSSGQVFRGVHLEQRKLAALRVFQVPMGMTPESRQAYAAQLERLKALRHGGLVRCYGGGFDTRKAYLAYELIDGESLDAMLERRQRLPWETAIDFTRQLAQAMEFAHQAGWIHGRLKPDKLIIASDGSVKVSDFREEAIASTIGGKPSLEQLQYTAPEVLRGEAPSAKSDLYSIGAIMYAMLTGRPPFEGDATQIQDQVQNKPTPSVSATVMDCPVWLSAIVDQLLEKDPQKRPFSATALLLAFKEAEKRQSQGVGVLQHATAGFSPLQMKVDRDEAEKVLGIKKKKKKKRKQDDTSFFEKPWVIGLLLVVGVAAVVYTLMPRSESALRASAESNLPPKTDEWTDWNDARGDLRELVRRFPESQSLSWAEEQIDWIDAREAERRLIREERRGRDSKWKDFEVQYWKASEFEQAGDLATALAKYKAVGGLYADVEEARSIVYLANEATARIEAMADDVSPTEEFLNKKLAAAQLAYDKNDLPAAQEIWDWIVTAYADDPQYAAQVQAAREQLESD